MMLIWTCLFLGTAVAFRDYQEHIPNGNRVPDPCHPNKLWQGVGHEQLSGGGDRNQFGKDFIEAGRNWTKTLCRKDSDGDGKTNGEELGDPKCVWTMGTVPTFLDNLSHPGVCDPFDATECAAFNTWQICQEDKFKCPPIEEEGVIKETFRMTRNKVPAKETTYQCQYMELPKDKDYHFIASEPFIDNANVMHHIVIRGCPNGVADEIKKDFSEPKECGMLSTICSIPLDIWSLGMLGTCIDAPAAFRFGKTEFSGFLMEFHWTNPSLRDDYWDSSGMTLYYTPNLRPHDASFFITGNMHLVLPPQQNQVNVNSFCSAKCTKKMKRPMNIISGWFHMHLLGKEGYVEWHHNGQKDTVIDEKFFSYDSPKNFVYKPELVVNPGDAFNTTCIYNTMTQENVTYWGDDTFSEMCFGIFTYYPKKGGTDMGCITAGEADCAAGDEEQECDLESVKEYKEEFLNGLYEYCDPSGQTCSKCCLLYLKSSLKGDACWRGIMREWAQFTITDGWANSTVKNMLLICEHMHDLDTLLLSENADRETNASRRFKAEHVFILFVMLSFMLLR